MASNEKGDLELRRRLFEYTTLLANLATTGSPGDPGGGTTPESVNINHTPIAAPYNITKGGSYLITNEGEITMPNPSGLEDGLTFKFVSVSGMEPTIKTIGNYLRVNSQAVDSFKLDVRECTLIVIDDLYEVI